MSRAAADMTRLLWIRGLSFTALVPLVVAGWAPRAIDPVSRLAGGAWNASIVAEYVHSRGDVRVTEGLGALVSVAAEDGQLSLLAGSVLAMVAIVVLVNRTLWARLYRLAESRYSR